MNVVGDHATYHKRYDAPLESDLDSLAHSVSGWVRRPSRPEDVGPDAADAVAAAGAGGGAVATLILPADVSWGKGGHGAPPRLRRPVPLVPGGLVKEVADVLNGGEPAVLLLGGRALRQPALDAAARVGAATGTRVLAETFPARQERGGSRPAFDRLGYFAESRRGAARGHPPSGAGGGGRAGGFLCLPGPVQRLVPPDGARSTVLAETGEDVAAALVELADRLDGGTRRRGALRPRNSGGQPPARALSLSPAAIGAVVGVNLPEGAVIVDEAITASLGLAAGTAAAPPHDWLSLTGGAIGQGLPVATGAAVASPGRRTICVEADGSAMYTIQALWTQARESLDVTTIVVSNRAYAILQIEMHRVQADPPGPTAAALLGFDRPTLDLVAVARGLGVPAESATTVQELDTLFRRSLSTPGPFVIEAVLPPR